MSAMLAVDGDATYSCTCLQASTCTTAPELNALPCRVQLARLTKRTEFVARRVWEYLQATDPMSKTIVFCDDQPHAERMRQELVKLIPEAASNRRYVVRITGDDTEGKAQLSYFIDTRLKKPTSNAPMTPSKTIPSSATTKNGRTP